MPHAIKDTLGLFGLISATRCSRIVRITRRACASAVTAKSSTGN